MIVREVVREDNGKLAPLARRIVRCRLCPRLVRHREAAGADHVDLVLGLEADRMRHLLLDSREIDSEREVVGEERRTRTEDDPDGYLSEEFLAAAYKAHPYGRPVIGRMEDLQRINYDVSTRVTKTSARDRRWISSGSAHPRKALHSSDAGCRPRLLRWPEGVRSHPGPLAPSVRGRRA